MANQRIDNIAQYRQQHRGPPPKRRTDFSIFHCSSSYSFNAAPDVLVGSGSHSIDGSSNAATTRFDSVKYTGKGSRGCTLVPCSTQHDMQTQLSNGHLTDTDTSDPNEQAEPSSDRDLAQEEFIPQTLESQLTRSSDGCTTPCSDERDNNSSDGIRDTPKQASNGKDHAARRQLYKSPDKKNMSNPQQQSSGGLTLSNSTELEDEYSERGRGKRKRKPKARFDEETDLPVKSAKKLRRFRIMRYLGLMAPVGSPF